MKRITVILFSLMVALLLAGLCSCKQEVTPEEQTNDFPEWDKSSNGLQNLPEIDVTGAETGVSEALIYGLYNPPEFKSAKNLIVIVCEGLTSELIESAAQNGNLIINSLPVAGRTTSKFTSSDGKLLSDYIRNDQFKTITGIMVHGDTACNSMRRITTTKDNDAEASSVYYSQFLINPPLVYVMGLGDFDEEFSPGSAEYLNEVYKSSGKKVSTMQEAIELFKNENVKFDAGGSYQHEGAVRKLFTIFESSETMPSYRQEMAFSLAWMQWKMDRDGFCLISSYCADSLDAAGVKEFDEGVAVAAKYVLENPDTALLICGCPKDGSEAEVCFYGLGKGVSARSTMYEGVQSLYEK